MNGTPWPIDQTVFLVRHYATMPTAELSQRLGDFGIPRSISAVHAKARFLQMAKREHRGHFTKQRAAELAALRERPAPLRQKIIDILVRDEESSMRYLSEQTGATLSSCWKVCQVLIQQKNAHVTRWEQHKGGWAAFIRIGHGKNAPKPTAEIIRNHTRPQPVPRPTIGPWGLCWGSTDAGVPAERKAA